MEKQTHTLDTPDVDLVYDVVGPLPTTDGQPPLLMAGHPMAAEGFFTVAEYFPERTVVVYDPRGVGRSVRKDGRTERSPELHSADLHALITEIGAPVDIFASSGGAVNSLALVAEHPDDVRILVAHEPPLLALLPDADAALAAETSRHGRLPPARVRRGHGAVHRPDVMAGRVQRRLRGAAGARPGDVRDADRGRRRPRRPAAVRHGATGSPRTAPTPTPSTPRRRGSSSASAWSRATPSPVARRSRWRRPSARRRSSSPATTAASSAASSGMRVSPRRSRRGFTRSSTPRPDRTRFGTSRASSSPRTPSGPGAAAGRSGFGHHGVGQVSRVVLLGNRRLGTVPVGEREQHDCQHRVAESDLTAARPRRPRWRGSARSS